MKRGAKKRTAKAVLLRPGRRARMMQMADVRKKCKKCRIRPFTPYGQALNGFSGHQGRFFAVLIDGVGAAHDQGIELANLRDILVGIG